MGTLPPGPVVPASWYPTVDTVGAILRARTKDSAGAEVGTFNTDTRPTAAEVDLYLQMAAASLWWCAGPWLPNTLWATSNYLIAIRAAMHVELSYWPEQIETDQSPYKELRLLFEAQWAQLCQVADNYRPDDVIPPGEADMLPGFYFGDGANPCGGSLEWVPRRELWRESAAEPENGIWWPT